MSRKPISIELKISRFITQRLADSKTRAEKKAIDHNIDSDFIKYLLKVSGRRCALTQRKFVFEPKHPDNFSVDRIDSSKGYTKDNVWLVTTWANRAKSDLTLDEFIKSCKLIAEAA